MAVPLHSVYLANAAPSDEQLPAADKATFAATRKLESDGNRVAAKLVVG